MRREDALGREMRDRQLIANVRQQRGVRRVARVDECGLEEKAGEG